MVSDADDDHLSRLVAVINERVSAMTTKARTASPAQLLAMVALGLADDLIVAEARARDIEDMTRETIETAIAQIDRRLAQADAP